MSTVGRRKSHCELSDPKKLIGHDPTVQFARNLAAQEARRWTEYLEQGTGDALKAWRHVRLQLQQAGAA